MSGLIKRTISRFLSKIIPVDEEIRYIDFFEPVKNSIRTSALEDTQGDNVPPNVHSEEVIAIELTPFQATLEIGIPAATAQSYPAEAPSLVVVHPDDDWFASEPFDSPSSLSSTEKPSQLGELEAPAPDERSTSTSTTRGEHSARITVDANPFASENQVADEQSTHTTMMQTVNAIPTTTCINEQLIPDNSYEIESIYFDEADIYAQEYLSNDTDITNFNTSYYDSITIISELTDDDETDWLLDEELVAEIAEPQSVPFEDLSDWNDNFFELEVHRASPVEEEVDENLVWRAGAHAASLVNQFEIARNDQRSHAVRWLKELLVEFPYGSSHAAIARMVYAGTTFHQLIEAASIIRWWRSDPTLWLIRRYDHLQRQWVINIDHMHGRTALSWRHAAKLSANLDAIEALALLTGEWRDSWIQLTPDSLGAGAFATYVASKTSNLGDLDFVEIHDEYAGPGAYNWLSELEPTVARGISPDGRLAYHTALPAPREFPKDSKRKDADAPK